MPELLDDLGHRVLLTVPPRRVVSLVPSLTESLAVSAPDVLVGATDWCTHPAGLDVPRVRGTKNPDLDAVAALQPDLVIANQEENRELDVRRLRERGIQVWVSVTESVDGALRSLDRLFREVLQQDEEPAWLGKAKVIWADTTEPVATGAIAIWRDPWMVVGSSTFAGDLLARLGITNVYADHPDRYPKVDLGDLDADDRVVLLPDEPYVFTVDDGPEAFSRARTALVSGRLLTWYGPSLVEARTGLAEQLAGILGD